DLEARARPRDARLVVPVPCERVAQAVDSEHVTLPDLREIRLVLEHERRDALGDEVAAMDPGERLRDHGADAEGLGREGRVLAARALTVVLPRDDEATAALAGPLRERGIGALERELGDRVHVR